jgi:hypothetical protein
LTRCLDFALVLYPVLLADETWGENEVVKNEKNMTLLIKLLVITRPTLCLELRKKCVRQVKCVGGCGFTWWESFVISWTFQRWGSFRTPKQILPIIVKKVFDNCVLTRKTLPTYFFNGSRSIHNSRNGQFSFSQFHLTIRKKIALKKELIPYPLVRILLQKALFRLNSLFVFVLIYHQE